MEEAEEVEEDEEEEVDIDGGFDDDELPPLLAPAAARIPALLRLRHGDDRGEAPPATRGPERAGRGRGDGEREGGR